MHRCPIAALGAAAVAALAMGALTISKACAQAANIREVEIGSLNCSKAGGGSFVFGSSKEFDCVLARNDGVGERFTGTIGKFGVDAGFATDAKIVWLVFVVGQVTPGVIAGDYAAATAAAAARVGAGSNYLIGGSNKQVILQPLSIEGREGLNAAAGIAEMRLRVAQ
jgi:hypothetical protein